MVFIAWWLEIYQLVTDLDNLILANLGVIASTFQARKHFRMKPLHVFWARLRTATKTSNRIGATYYMKALCSSMSSLMLTYPVPKRRRSGIETPPSIPSSWFWPAVSKIRWQRECEVGVVRHAHTRAIPILCVVASIRVDTRIQRVCHDHQGVRAWYAVFVAANLRKEKLVDVIWVVLLELWQSCADMPVYRDGEDIDGGNSKWWCSNQGCFG